MASPARAQDGERNEGTGTLGDVIVDALESLLHGLFAPIEGLLENHADGLIELVVGTPHPDAVFTAPTNGPWPDIYTYYWEVIIPLSLLLWALAIGLVIFLESTSYLFSNYHRSKLKRRAFSGLLGILAWWWMAALSLRFVNTLAGFLVPNLSNLTLFETASFTTIGVLGVIIALAVDLALFVLMALIYFIRQLVLYLFVLLMPILFVLWIPGVGPFAPVARFARQLAGFFVPFLFMTVPVALLFRLGDLLGSSADLSMAGLGAWLTALVIPILAVLSPIVLVWQAGAIFFIADRAAHRVSTTRARNRLDAAQTTGARTLHSGRNFGRGLRNAPPVRRDGQTLLANDASRAHQAGAALSNSTQSVAQSASRIVPTRADAGTSAPIQPARPPPLQGGTEPPVLQTGLPSDKLGLPPGPIALPPGPEPATGTGTSSPPSGTGAGDHRESEPGVAASQPAPSTGRRPEHDDESPTPTSERTHDTDFELLRSERTPPSRLDDPRDGTDDEYHHHEDRTDDS